jgi:uncharacterized protein
VPVVSNTSPLIVFARSDHLDLLHELFGEVWIPTRVAREAFRDHPARPGAAALLALVSLTGTWLREEVPGDSALIAALMSEVDAGEAAAIALAHEHQSLLLIDDPAGRQAARARGVRVIGSAGAVGLARRRGLLARVRPTLDELLLHGLRLSAGLYRQILTDEGEDSAETARPR